MLQLNTTYLSHLLDKRGISISEFCEERLGISRTTFYTWMNEPSTVRLFYIEMIAKELNVPVAELINVD